jgi:hypothetical protein
MNHMLIYPTEENASSVVLAMTGENSLSTKRMATGDQHFVYEVKTAKSEYVIRMTDLTQKNKFIAAMYWQDKLLPLGIPLAKFIQSDLECKLSPFPSLLMMRLPGSDICNVYSQLTDLDKRNLANEIVKIQAMTSRLPDGLCYGITDSYEKTTEDLSWYDFLVNRLHRFEKIIQENGVFNDIKIDELISIAKDLKNDFNTIYAKPFLWDASERNVIVNNGTISGIVDVDEICFGDPLLVIGLTYTALEIDGHDTLYCDYWAKMLKMDNNAKTRLAFYRMFYAIGFMCKHSMISSNKQQIIFDTQRLKNMLQESLTRVQEYRDAIK